MDFHDKQLMNAIEKIGRFCLDKDLKLAVAESVTAGMIQVMMSTCVQAGLFFEGGMTAYSCFQKFGQLSVAKDQCREFEGVSSRISEKMALEIAKKFNCAIGIGITGFASPIPEKGIEELYAYCSLAVHGDIVHTDKLSSTSTSQFENQKYYAAEALKKFARKLEEQK